MVRLNNKERNLLMDALNSLSADDHDPRDEQAIEKLYEKLKEAK